MFNISLTAILSFLITFFSIPVIIQVAKEKKLFDEPGERKIHKSVIPTLGGLGIFAGVIVSLLLFTPAEFVADFRYLCAAFVVIFFLGMKDDILVLSVGKKFTGQLIAAALVVKLGGISIDNMHGFIGIEKLPEAGSVALSIFTIIVITNSFNLVDGVDGLAGSLGLLTSFVLGAYFFLNGLTGFSVLAFALCGSLLGFLYFNFSPAKIFMGDTGSLLIGLINSILVIKFISFAPGADINLPLQASPAIGFAIVMIPLIDTLQVFTIRLIEGKSPFHPDRNHIHHALLDLGLSHKQISIYLCIAGAGFISLSYFLRHLGTSLVIGILLTISLLLSALVYYFRQKALQSKNQISRETEILKTRNIFQFYSDPVEVE
jgi:UDP-N-acetylmuramyl pentapeptide phosphotransferase/UDP-N-acetylglucosamine-1-phosphate transferase